MRKIVIFTSICMIFGCMDMRSWKGYNNSDQVKIGGVEQLDPTEDPNNDFYGYDYNPYDYSEDQSRQAPDPENNNVPDTPQEKCRQISAGSEITADCSGMDIDLSKLKDWGDYCVRDCECKTGFCSSPIPGQGRCAVECGWYYCNNDESQELRYLDCPQPGTGGCVNTYFDKHIGNWPQAYRQSCLNPGESLCDPDDVSSSLLGAYCIIRNLPKNINVHGKYACRKGKYNKYFFGCEPDCSYPEVDNNGFDDDCNNVDLSTWGDF